MKRTWFVGALALWFALPAAAQESKISKAAKFFDKYAGSKEAFLAKARDNILPARDHIDTRDQAGTWVLYADIAREYALNDDFGSPWADPLVEAIAAYDTATGKDDAPTFHERILEGVLTLESTANTRMVDAYERKDFDSAWAVVVPLIDAHGIVRQIGRLDANREQAVMQYATLIAIDLGKLGDATQYHKELDAIGGRKSGTTKALADALIAVDEIKALKFVTRWSDKDPAEATLLATRFDLLFRAKKVDDVRELLEQQKGDRGSAIAITLLHARTLDQVGDTEAASATYRKALELEPNNQEVLRGHAALLLRTASKLTESDDTEAINAARVGAIELLQKSMALDNEHLATLQSLLELYKVTEHADKDAVSALATAISDLQ